jgi:hypothetical protein
LILFQEKQDNIKNNGINKNLKINKLQKK